MLTARSKFTKTELDATEESVAKAIYDLQLNADKLKQSLREVSVVSAKEVEVADGKKAVLIFVPPPQIALYQKMIKERSLIEELEKKFSGKHVIVVAERRIIRKENRNSRQLKQLRPRSRTLTAVHDAILKDLVYPNEIVGRRIRFQADGSRLFKVHLYRDAPPASEKVETFVKVYKTLTGKDVVFEFKSNF